VKECVEVGLSRFRRPSPMVCPNHLFQTLEGVLELLSRTIGSFQPARHAVQNRRHAFVELAL